MDQSQSEKEGSRQPVNSVQLYGEERWEIVRRKPEFLLPGLSATNYLRTPAKFFRKNREKMLAISSSSASPRTSRQRPIRLRRSIINKAGDDAGGTKTLSSADGSKKKCDSASEDTKGKQGKVQPPPLTPTQVMVRKLYERINRAYKASLRESVKQVWKENQETLNMFVKKHHRMQSAMATSSILLSHDIVESNDIHDASLKSASYKSTTVEKIKVIVIPEKMEGSNAKLAERQCQTIPVTTIGHVIQIPPVLDWTAIPHNLHEDDGKFLTNIPFLGDEFIENSKFIDEMVTLYEGKVHEAKDSSSFRKMDDEVLYSLVQAMIKIEAEEGPDVFKEDQTEKTSVLSAKDKNKVDIPHQGEGEKVSQQEEDASIKTTFSDVAAKLFQSTEEINVESVEQTSTTTAITALEHAMDVADLTTIKNTEADGGGQSMEIDFCDDQTMSKKLSSAATSSDHTENGVLCNVKDKSEATSRPSELIFSILSSTFTGLGTQKEIRERYENFEKVKLMPVLPILSNGMEQQLPESYSIPNIEGPFAKYLPKEATMHAYHVLFCRRCFTYDCKRHTGDDQVDVKYYKSRQIPLQLPSTSSGSTFNFLCKNPDCWMMNDMVARNQESILMEWSPGDRSLFSCLIESFPSNYCFIAYMMRNKSCAQVKEYADLEHVPKMESCGGSASSRTKSKHRKPRMGFHKKSSGNSHSKRNVTRRWINNVKKTEKSREEGGIKSAGLKLPPRYMPCLHENGGECDSSCTCRINKTSCEKFCTCALTCPYRFPGCKCLSTCDSKRCICFAAARECDPDLCFGCGANEHNLDKISCHNVNIQRKLHKHLLMGKSDISGWGIYIQNHAHKGDFIAEYRGELISHDESERRGHVYDKIQHTFLFELNDHFVVDATRKGNKARFVNSSKNPNCEVKRMFVNGDHRIGIYAKRFIEAGEELFYDYEDVLEKQQKAAEGANRNRRD